MTLEEFYYISQIVAVIGIFGSLVFVGLQIRQNTRATQAASHHAVSNSLNEINRLFIESEEVTKIWLSEEKGIRTVLASPGCREWWTENPYGFGAKFRTYVAALAKTAAVKS